MTILLSLHECTRLLYLLVAVHALELFNESIFLSRPVTLDETGAQMLMPALTTLLSRAIAHGTGNHGPLWLFTDTDVVSHQVSQLVVFLPFAWQVESGKVWYK